MNKKEIQTAKNFQSRNLRERKNEMLKTKSKKLIFALLRSLIIFFLFIGITAASRAVIADYLSYIDDLKKEFLDKLLNYWCLLVAIFLFNSIARSVKFNNDKAKELYLERCPSEQTFISNALDTFRDLDFWLDIGVISAFSIALPTSVTYPYVSQLLFAGIKLSPTALKACTLLVALPVLFLLNLLASTAARNHYRYSKPPQKQRPEFVRNIFSLAVLSAIYYFGFSYAFKMLFPFIVTVCNLFRGQNVLVLFLKLLGIIFIIVAIFVAIAYVKALRIRRAFVKDLKSACEKMGAQLSEIKKPYASLFIAAEGISFTVEKNDKRYDCKFVSSIMKGLPMVFFDNGCVMYHHTFKIFKVNLFHFVTRTQFGFESENRKILIAVPMPKTFFVAAENDSKPKPADVGEIIGEYQIYNGTGFINALDRDCIGKK